MLSYFFNVFYDANSERMPGKGIFLSIANEDETAAKRNREDVLKAYPDARFLGCIRTDIKEEWRK